MNEALIPADDARVVEVDIDGKYIIFVEISDICGDEARAVYEQLGYIKRDLEAWLKDDGEAFFIWLNKGAKIRLEKVEL